MGSENITITFAHSKIETTVSVNELTKQSIDFLDNYASVSLVGNEFSKQITNSDGIDMHQQLLSAAGYANDSTGFFKEILNRIAEGPVEEIIINNFNLPYMYLVHIMEAVLPGNGFVSIYTVDELIHETNVEIPDSDRANLQKVIDTYPVRLSKHTIRQMMISKDVAYQYLPFVEELDPVGHTNTWIGQFHEGLLEQMYQNRVIFLLNMSCPVYCRFCFRKHKESRNEANPSVEDINNAIEYVGKTDSVKEIVITGGDPFMNRKNMEAAIDGLTKIPHVQTLRLATRSVAYFPHLFTANNSSYLKYLLQKNNELQAQGKRMEIATHFIHPDEVSTQSLALIRDFVKSGVTVYVQTPFLQNCNDNGPALKKLFGLLRGAGAEMHYIYIPCSPIHGNSVYWSPLSDGIDIAEYLRAHLSDRSVPKICTATPIGKIEWYTSGWAVEPVKDNPDFIWIRTPYTPAYFKSFAPVANDLPNIRVNSEGTIDIQYMAKMGKEKYFLGSRPLRITKSEIPISLPDRLQIDSIRPLLKSRPIAETGSQTLERVHETRVELDIGAPDSDYAYIAANPLVSDVVLTGKKEPVFNFKAIEKTVKKLSGIPTVNAVRIRSLAFNYSPEIFTDDVIEDFGSLNKLSIANPLRLEIETWFINSEEIRDLHKDIVRKLNTHGITVYSNTPLLGGINDTPDEIYKLTYAYRKSGIEFHHLYIAGLEAQYDWNSSHPVDLYDVVDIASKIRREGSGREGPRYVIQTPFGEVYYGLTSSFIHENEHLAIRLDSYNIEYVKNLDENATLPEDIHSDEEGKLVMKMTGLVSSTGFSI